MHTIPRGESLLWRRQASRRHDGKLSNCWTIDAFWADIDFKDRPDAEARRRLDTFAQEPNVVVRSGGGLHCYWVLDEPADVQTSEPRIRNILRRLARAVGGDLYSAEPARVLRIPGTLNYKYDPPRRVSIERFNLAHTLTELDERLPPEPDGRAGNRRQFMMPATIGDGSRNATLFRAARSLAAKELEPGPRSWRRYGLRIGLGASPRWRRRWRGISKS